MRDMGCGMLHVGYGIWDVGFRVWDEGYGMLHVEYGMWDIGCRIWDAGCSRGLRARGGDAAGPHCAGLQRAAAYKQGDEKGERPHGRGLSG